MYVCGSFTTQSNRVPQSAYLSIYNNNLAILLEIQVRDYHFEDLVSILSSLVLAQQNFDLELKCFSFFHVICVCIVLHVCHTPF